MVHQVYAAVAGPAGIPLIGMGGIQTWQDAVEFLLAGATGVAVGTALFVDPTSPIKIMEGLADYLAERKLKRVVEMIGRLEA
jgi:dihydroorotate dehydrogenase (NAD+) catalytic subunit